MRLPGAARSSARRSMKSTMPSSTSIRSRSPMSTVDRTARTRLRHRSFTPFPRG